MNIYDRPMFRKKGGATGIMASGPELIKRSNGGGLNIVSSAKANPLLTGDNQIIQIPQGGGTITVPFFGQRQPENRFNTEIETPDFEFGRTPMVTPVSFGAIPGTNPAGNIVQDDFEKDKSGTFGKKINESSKNILDKKTTENKEIVDEETGDVVTTTEDDEGLVTDGTSTTDTGTDTTTTQFNFRDIKNKTADEIKKIQNLYSQYSTDLSNLNNANILGKTYDKHKEEYIAALNKRPEEATFEDVRDSAFDLLGFDRESLDEKLTKDQQGSIWLNMMRAGLAMAAGESPNALTNVAKGFQVGLEGYGRDMRNLTDDYREDIEKHQNTMYRLLKDKKSENIAKNALDVQRKAAEFAIVRDTRGEERKELLDKLNTEVTMRKLKIESMSTLANYDLEKFKLDKSSAEFNELLEIKKAQIAGLLPDEIKAAQGQGLVKVKNPSKLITADNLELTEKGIEQEFDLVKSLKESSKKYRPSESIQKIKILGRKGGFGLKAKPGVELSEEVQNELGLTLQNLTKSTSPFMKAQDPLSPNADAALKALITEYRPLKDKGIILEYKSLPEFIKEAIENQDIDDGATLQTYQDNTELFVGSPQ
mgnify:CR=1 FL=1